MALLSTALGLPIAQSQVDFVIPDIDQDLRLCIDPFLLYKSKDEEHRALHDRLLEAFNRAFRYYRDGNYAGMERLIDFPEVDNIGLGYSGGRIAGSGMGAYLNRLVVDTLANSPALLERGVRHIEELQLVSVGIGPDRISDMAANLLKADLVAYTREQCTTWDIPIEKGVPLNHIFDLDSFSWYDDYVDLPINPRTGVPLLFVPRRIVRLLPWINFDDYERQQYRLYLRAKKGRGWDALPGAKAPTTKESKGRIVEVTRREIHLLDEYVARKEAYAADAQPEISRSQENANFAPQAQTMLDRLWAIAPGIAGAGAYQREMLGILTYLFSPDLTDGKLEERTIDGTERRDIVFTNEADRSFWEYVRQQYGGLFVMFEAKNVAQVNSQHINQVATYLGDRIGRFGVILTRNQPAQAQIRKTHTVFNNDRDRKSILIMHDSDIERMLRLKDRGSDPTREIQQMYRDFKMKIE